jgi:DNA/RNA endonuclease YhcR with UshA esterase domain
MIINRTKKPGVVLVASLLLASGCAQTPSAAPILDATDPAAIQSAMPKPVTVAGVVDKTRDSDGVLIINFKDTDKSEFYAVILAANRDTLNAAFGGDVGKAIEGKPVRVTGKVVEYHGKPEIIISTADQLVVQ